MSCQSNLVLFVCLLIVHVTPSFPCHTGCKCTKQSTKYWCNGLKKIPTKFNTTVLEFTCKNCHLGKVTADDLVGLTNATLVSLIGSEITEVEPFAFSALKNLREVDLDGNRLKVLDGRSFVGCDRLNNFYASANDIDNIEYGLGMLNSLKNLMLRGNKLKEIPRFFMSANFPLLDYINLNDNDIQEVKPYAFYGLPALTYLELKRNKIRKVHENAFERVTKLQTLEMTDNELETLPDDTCKSLQNLHDVYFGKNRISVIKYSFFQYCRSVEYLDLTGMKTGVSVIEKSAFVGLSNLKALTLSRNGLVLNDGSVLNSLKNLTELYLWDNNLTDIPQGMDLPVLEILGVSDNKISKLSSLNLPKLRTLYAANNELTHLPDNLNLYNSNELSNVDLSGNKLTKIFPSSLANFPLTRLNIMSNQIVKFAEADLKSMFSKIKNLYINGNPIHCNCEAKWLNSVTWAYCFTPHTKALRYAVFNCVKPSVVSNETKIWTNGENIHLLCKATGDPIPDIYWEGVSIANGQIKKYKISPNNSNTTVARGRFGPVQGMYHTVHEILARASVPGIALAFTCKAGNVAGNASITLPLTTYV